LMTCAASHRKRREKSEWLFATDRTRLHVL
jgi:predicted Fe-S protein YdhL (DUF1289 family)